MKLKPSTGVTFRVHDVEAVRTPLETCKTRDSIRQILKNVDLRPQSPVLSCSGYNSDVVANMSYHALIGAIHIAFAEHRPLVLTPDAIWVAILHGLAQHVHNHSEELRPVLVSHLGRKDMVIELNIDPDSPESAWDLVISEFSARLSEEVGDKSAALASDFSTTGAVERLVSQVCLLDVFEPFFEYVLYSGCGIPEITLTGNRDDWLKLRGKIELLKPFQLDWWLPHLRGIANQFCRAFDGDVDREFWQDIYKQRTAYGVDCVNGWIVKLIPYLQNGVTGNWDVVNPIVNSCSGESVAEGEMTQYSDGVRTDELPSGMSLVPFRCFDKQGIERSMQMIGGFLGVEQDATTLAVQPKLGWAVRRMQPFEWNLLDVDCLQKTPPLPRQQFTEFITTLQEANRYNVELPGDFIGFYKRCDGVEFCDDAGHSWKIRSINQLAIVDSSISNKWESTKEEWDKSQLKWVNIEDDSESIWVTSEKYIRFFEGRDGSFAAMRLRRRKLAIYDVRLVQADGTCSVIFTSFLNFVAFMVESGLKHSE